MRIIISCRDHVSTLRLCACVRQQACVSRIKAATSLRNSHSSVSLEPSTVLFCSVSPIHLLTKMADRPKGFGMTAEIQDRVNAMQRTCEAGSR